MAYKSEASPGPRAVGLAVGGLIGLLAVDLDLTSLVSLWEQRAPLVVLAALSGALFWRTRLRALFVLAAAALSALWLAVSFTPLDAWLAKGLLRSDPVKPADAVFVFGSGLQLDGGLTPGSMSRLLHGLELVASGQAPRLVVSEEHAPAPSYAPRARELMGRLNLAGELIAVGPITNTHDEAVAVAALLRQRGWRRVLGVTGPAHSRRACAALESQGITVVCSPSVEAAFDFDTLEKPDDRRKAFGSLIHERVGLLVYRRRGWIK